MPTSVSINPVTVSLTALGDTQRLAAMVFDQNGRIMAAAIVVWATTDASVVTVTATGLAAAVGVGSGSVRATATNAQGTVPVTVTQNPAQLIGAVGNGQSAVVGQQVTAPLVGQVNDAGGFAVPGIVVAFAVTQGGGSLTATLDTTGADGRALTRWTLGTSTTSGQQVTVSSGSLTPVTFAATAIAGPADTVAVQAGDGQTAGAGAQLPVDPAVLIRDVFANAKDGAVVTFAVTTGGGFVGSPQVTSDVNGVARADWTLGNLGTNALRATVSGEGIGGNPITFNATAVPPGPPASIAVLEGDGQTGLQGYALNIPPAVVVRDASNGPVGGVPVDFAVATGGGSATGATATTSLFGIARVGSWTIGSGSNTLTSTAGGAGITGNPLTFQATGVAPGAYDLDVRFLTPMTAAQREAFDSAEATWERLIFGDVPDGLAQFPGGTCGPGSPPINETIDDVLIFASITSIDGPGGTLGQAGPCLVRNVGFQPGAGLMRFDSADVANLLASGLLDEVILHEMGHVLGFGTIWGPTQLNLLRNPALSGNNDPHFVGAQAIRMFDGLGGTGYLGGARVPVENQGGPGTADAHWRESVFFDELMTGFINTGANPLSAVTVASMGDEAYVVNFAGADPFAFSFPLWAGAAGPILALGDDIWHGPIFVIDAGGRVIRVIRQ